MALEGIWLDLAGSWALVDLGFELVAADCSWAGSIDWGQELVLGCKSAGRCWPVAEGTVGSGRTRLGCNLVDLVADIVAESMDLVQTDSEEAFDLALAVDPCSFLAHKALKVVAVDCDLSAYGSKLPRTEVLAVSLVHLDDDEPPQSRLAELALGKTFFYCCCKPLVSPFV